MRFDNYIVESDIDTIDRIIRDVDRDLLEAMVRYGRGLYRGYKEEITGLKRFVTRSERQPKDTPRYIHTVLDELFLKKFGWKARSEGVFVSCSPSTAEMYGDVSWFFPIGKYDALYSDKVMDAYSKLGDMWRVYIHDIVKRKSPPILPVHELEGDKGFEEYVKNTFPIDTYKHFDPSVLGIKGVKPEITFRCKEYYMISIDSDEFSLKELKKRLGL